MYSAQSKVICVGRSWEGGDNSGCLEEEEEASCRKAATGQLANKAIGSEA